MKVKNILFFVLFFGLFQILSAQNENSSAKDTTVKVPFKKRLVYNLGIGGGYVSINNISNVNFNLHPQVGYKIRENLIAGVGVNYQYLKSGISKYQVYGGNTFLRYHINQQFFLQTEYQKLKYSYQATSSDWNDYLLVGGGYYPARGLYISAYYLLKYPANNNIYGAPYLIRGGFTF